MAAAKIHLTGYRFSVYTRIVHLVLLEKGLSFSYCEIDPFQPEKREGLIGLHPFGRVPVLTHDGFRIFETSAILAYLDAAFPKPGFMPAHAFQIARMHQVIGVVDSYGYQAMVRQVFGNLIFRPREGLRGSKRDVRAGLEASRTVLAVLEDISREGYVLTGESLTLADFYLAPMMDYFCQTEPGCSMLNGHRSLAAWWAEMEMRPSIRRTAPDLEQVPKAIP